MNDQIAGQPLTVVLSREELMAVLELLGAGFIPGLDPDPLGDLTPEGRELALTVARRALQARQLAQPDDTGRFLVHRSLLKAVGICAFSQSALLAWHWPRGGDTPLPFFGHVRDGDAVSHTRPADVLHRFTVLPSQDALLGSLLDFCGCTGEEASQLAGFTVSREAFTRARETATSDVKAAVADLEKAGVPAAAAQALAVTLGADPRVSAVQALKQGARGEAESHEVTVIQNGAGAWWVAPSGEGALAVKPVTPQQICEALAEWL